VNTDIVAVQLLKFFKGQMHSVAPKYRHHGRISSAPITQYEQRN